MPTYELTTNDGSTYSIDADTPDLAQQAFDHAFGAKPSAPQTTGFMANAGAGANDFIANAAGAPVDLAAGALNLAGRGANAAFGTNIPTIRNPIGGAESIKSALGLIGADPRNIAATTPGEQTARAIGGAIPATIAPYLAGRAAIEAGVTAPWAKLLGGTAGPGQSGAQTAAGALGNAAVGAGGTIGGETVQSMLPEDSPYRGVANFAGQVAGGALTGAALSKAANMAARVVQPNVNPDVTRLQNIGVTPTPGQTLGGSLGRAEEAAMSLPLGGDAIRSARQRTIEQLNRGTINHVLAPIGERLGTTTELGRDAIDEAWGKISQAYNNAVPNAGAKITPQAISDLQKVYSMAQNGLPADLARIYENRLRQYVTSQISDTGHMSGEAFKAAESDLGRDASSLLNNHNSNSWDRALGNALRETQAILRRSLEDANPESESNIRAANSSFAQMLRVGAASAKPGAEPGVFAPAQLQQSVRSFANGRQFERGNAPLQDIADAARSVLGNRVPDSGTPYRSMIALLGAGMANPALLLKYGATAGALSGLYSSPGQRLLSAMLTQRPAAAAPVADVIRSAPPPMGAAVSSPLFKLLAP